MDDNGNIIYYILLGVIYLLSRVFGKKKKKPGQPAQRPNRTSSGNEESRHTTVSAPTAEKEPELSFEDILRELSGVPQPKPKADPPPAQPTPSLDALEPETGIRPAPAIEGNEQPFYSIDEIDQIASEFKVPKPIGSERLTEPDLAALRRKDLSFKRDDKYSIKTKRTVNYLDILNSQDGPARAFVLSEIFNRKY